MDNFTNFVNSNNYGGKIVIGAESQKQLKELFLSFKVVKKNLYPIPSNNAIGIGGGINIIDLANISTCAFIETKDLGKKMNEFKFKVMGRFDGSEIRGCNQLF